MTQNRKETRFYYKDLGTWIDTMCTDIPPAVMKSVGWVPCTEGEYHLYQDKDWKRKAGLVKD